MAIKVLLTETQSMLGAGIKSILGEDLDIIVIGDNDNVLNVDDQISETNPDIVLLDLTTDESGGIQMIRALDGKRSGTKLLVINDHLNDKIHEELNELGVSGIISKERIPKELLSAIHKLAGGEQYFSTIQSKPHSRENRQDKQASSQINLPVLYTKLHRPRISDDHILRSDIIEILERNLEKPLSLVSAPAGYGKSLTVSQWLDQTRVKSAWISLDEELNDPRVFLMYLQAAIEKVFPAALKETNTLIGAKELPPLKVIAYSLINEIDQIDEDFILVLDDYHRIHHKAIHDLLDEVLTYPPASLHICIATRIDPPLRLNSLLAHGRMIEIRMKQLSFSEAEIAHLYQKLIHIEVQGDTAKSLRDKTEGWIVGLRMASMIIRKNEDAENILKNIQGDIHSLSKYLLEEVLMKQPREYQEMLLITSVLDRFCPDLIDSMSTKVEGPNGNEFVMWLIKSDLFVISLDNQGIWYRYHHLIQDLLKKIFKDHHTKNQITDSHYKASSWLEKNGFIEEAIFHMLGADSELEACYIIERHCKTELNRDGWLIIQRWLQMIPEEIRRTRPQLIICECWGAYEDFNFEKLLSLLDQLKTLLNDGDDHRVFWGEFYLFYGLMTHWSGNGLGALEHLDNAAKLLPDVDNLATGMLYLHIALARSVIGQRALALQDIGTHISKDKENKVYVTRLMAGIFYINQFAANLPNAQHEAQIIQKISSKHQISYTYNMSVCMEATTCYSAGKLHDALPLFNIASENRYNLHKGTALDAMACKTIALQLLNRPEEADTALDLLERFEGESNPIEYQMISKSCRARLSLLRGDLETALQWEKTVDDVPSFAGLFVWLEVPVLTQIKVLIAHGKPESLRKAEILIKDFLKVSIDCHLSNQSIEAMVLKSLLLEKQGQKQAALDALSEVISLVEPGHFIHPFLEISEEALPLLEALKIQHNASTFINSLINTLEKNQRDLTLRSSGRVPKSLSELSRPHSDGEPLSNRELEITKLLAEGLRNKEIASKLFVSEGTIKKHIYNICQKWEVHSRIHLIQKAREMGYI